MASSATATRRGRSLTPVNDLAKVPFDLPSGAKQRKRASSVSSISRMRGLRRQGSRGDDRNRWRRNHGAVSFSDSEMDGNRAVSDNDDGVIGAFDAHLSWIADSVTGSKQVRSVYDGESGSYSSSYQTGDDEDDEVNQTVASSRADDESTQISDLSVVSRKWRVSSTPLVPATKRRWFRTSTPATKRAIMKQSPTDSTAGSSKLSGQRLSRVKEETDSQSIASSVALSTGISTKEESVAGISETYGPPGFSSGLLWKFQRAPPLEEEDEEDEEEEETVRADGDIDLQTNVVDHWFSAVQSAFSVGDDDGNDNEVEDVNNVRSQLAAVKPPAIVTVRSSLSRGSSPGNAAKNTSRGSNRSVGSFGYGRTPKYDDQTSEQDIVFKSPSPFRLSFSRDSKQGRCQDGIECIEVQPRSMSPFEIFQIVTTKKIADDQGSMVSSLGFPFTTESHKPTDEVGRGKAAEQRKGRAPFKLSRISQSSPPGRDPALPPVKSKRASSLGTVFFKRNRSKSSIGPGSKPPEPKDANVQHGAPLIRSRSLRTPSGVRSRAEQPSIAHSSDHKDQTTRPDAAHADSRDDAPYLAGLATMFSASKVNDPSDPNEDPEGSLESSYPSTHEDTSAYESQYDSMEENNIDNTDDEADDEADDQAYPVAVEQLLWAVEAILPIRPLSHYGVSDSYDGSSTTDSRNTYGTRQSMSVDSAWTRQTYSTKTTRTSRSKSTRSTFTRRSSKRTGIRGDEPSLSGTGGGEPSLSGTIVSNDGDSLSKGVISVTYRGKGKAESISGRTSDNQSSASTTPSRRSYESIKPVIVARSRGSNATTGSLEATSTKGSLAKQSVASMSTRTNRSSSNRSTGTQKTLTSRSSRDLATSFNHDDHPHLLDSTDSGGDMSMGFLPEIRRRRGRHESKYGAFRWNRQMDEVPSPALEGQARSGAIHDEPFQDAMFRISPALSPERTSKGSDKPNPSSTILGAHPEARLGPMFARRKKARDSTTGHTSRDARTPTTNRLKRAKRWSLSRRRRSIQICKDHDLKATSDDAPEFCTRISGQHWDQSKSAEFMSGKSSVNSSSIAPIVRSKGRKSRGFGWQGRKSKDREQPGTDIDATTPVGNVDPPSIVAGAWALGIGTTTPQVMESLEDARSDPAKSHAAWNQERRADASGDLKEGDAELLKGLLLFGGIATDTPQQEKTQGSTVPRTTVAVARNECPATPGKSATITARRDDVSQYSNKSQCLEPDSAASTKLPFSGLFIPVSSVDTQGMMMQEYEAVPRDDPKGSPAGTREKTGTDFMLEEAMEQTDLNDRPRILVSDSEVEHHSTEPSSWVHRISMRFIKNSSSTAGGTMIGSRKGQSNGAANPSQQASFAANAVEKAVSFDNEVPRFLPNAEHSEKFQPASSFSVRSTTAASIDDVEERLLSGAGTANDDSIEESSFPSLRQRVSSMLDDTLATEFSFNWEEAESREDAALEQAMNSDQQIILKKEVTAHQDPGTEEDRQSKPKSILKQPKYRSQQACSQASASTTQRIHFSTPRSPFDDRSAGQRIGLSESNKEYAPDFADGEGAPIPVWFRNAHLTSGDYPDPEQAPAPWWPRNAGHEGSVVENYERKSKTRRSALRFNPKSRRRRHKRPWDTPRARLVLAFWDRNAKTKVRKYSTETLRRGFLKAKSSKSGQLCGQKDDHREVKQMDIFDFSDGDNGRPRNAKDDSHNHSAGDEDLASEWFSDAGRNVDRINANESKNKNRSHTLETLTSIGDTRTQAAADLEDGNAIADARSGKRAEASLGTSLQEKSSKEHRAVVVQDGQHHNRDVRAPPADRDSFSDPLAPKEEPHVNAGLWSRISGSINAVMSFGDEDDKVDLDETSERSCKRTVVFKGNRNTLNVESERPVHGCLYFCNVASSIHTMISFGEEENQEIILVSQDKPQYSVENEDGSIILEQRPVGEKITDEYGHAELRQNSLTSGKPKKNRLEDDSISAFINSLSWRRQQNKMETTQISHRARARFPSPQLPASSGARSGRQGRPRFAFFRKAPERRHKLKGQCSLNCKQGGGDGAMSHTSVDDEVQQSDRAVTMDLSPGDRSCPLEKAISTEATILSCNSPRDQNSMQHEPRDQRQPLQASVASIVSKSLGQRSDTGKQSEIYSHIADASDAANQQRLCDLTDNICLLAESRDSGTILAVSVGREVVPPSSASQTSHERQAIASTHDTRVQQCRVDPDARDAIGTGPETKTGNSHTRHQSHSLNDIDDNTDDGLSLGEPLDCNFRFPSLYPTNTNSMNMTSLGSHETNKYSPASGFRDSVPSNPPVCHQNRTFAVPIDRTSITSRASNLGRDTARRRTYFAHSIDDPSPEQELEAYPADIVLDRFARAIDSPLEPALERDRANALLAYFEEQFPTLHRRITMLIESYSNREHPSSPDMLSTSEALSAIEETAKDLEAGLAEEHDPQTPQRPKVIIVTKPLASLRLADPQTTKSSDGYHQTAPSFEQKQETSSSSEMQGSPELHTSPPLNANAHNEEKRTLCNAVSGESTPRHSFETAEARDNQSPTPDCSASLAFRSSIVTETGKAFVDTWSFGDDAPERARGSQLEHFSQPMRGSEKQSAMVRRPTTASSVSILKGSDRLWSSSRLETDGNETHGNDVENQSKKDYSRLSRRLITDLPKNRLAAINLSMERRIKVPIIRLDRMSSVISSRREAESSRRLANLRFLSKKFKYECLEDSITREDPHNDSGPLIPTDWERFPKLSHHIPQWMSFSPDSLDTEEDEERVISKLALSDTFDPFDLRQEN